MPDQLTRFTAHLPVVSLYRATAMAPGHGVIVASQGKFLHGQSLWDPAGCNARVTHDFRRHSQEGYGCRDKEVHVSFPQPGHYG